MSRDSERYRAQLAQRNAAAALAEAASEALPDPREEADFALQCIPWLFPSDRRAVFEAIDEAGLTICWKVP